MKIYSMTATFGKLEHETLTLQPGLNVIHAPNEWGKSTWCAFLTAMLYGLDTRSRSTQTTLSEKEHYTPWSGSPMSGSMDLNWNGRDITIQRKTKGRSVFGDFRAFETHTGLPVPELTAANCGQLLLGVEKSVFTRSAFLRLSDLPVTQDDALRHRLNALVTTGDDSGTAEALEQKLKDLRNRCRYNRTGLLPQAEAEAAALERKISELDSLHAQAQNLRQQQSRLETQLSALENHQKALAYAQAQADTVRITQAENAREQAARRAAALEAACAGAPTREQAAQTVQAIQDNQQRHHALDAEIRRLSPMPVPPEVPAPFRGMTPEEAVEMVQKDSETHSALKKSIDFPWYLPLFAAVSLAVIVGAWLMQYQFPAMIGLVVLMAVAVFLLWRNAQQKKALEALCRRYGSAEPSQWLRLSQDYVNHSAAYTQALHAYEAETAQLDRKRALLDEETIRLCGSQSPATCLAQWQDILHRWADLADARQDLHQAEAHTNALRAMAKDAPPPEVPDILTHSPQETAYLISDTAAQLRLLHSRLGQCQGQMASIGHRDDLETRLDALRRRINHLEDTYAALTLALTTLDTARAELQRRFAPKITQRAQALMDRLTQGRYDRLLLAQDLSLHAAAQNEDTLRSALWRSDGTTDQLYLALRLAVAGELTPEAPLVLDDALVRFDDTRLAAAMDVLKEEAQTRQVLLFTCHQREMEYQ